MCSYCSILIHQCKSEHKGSVIPGDAGFLRCGNHLVVRGSESPTNTLVIKDLDFKAEKLLHVLDDHDKERQLDAQGGFGVCRA